MALCRPGRRIQRDGKEAPQGLFVFLSWQPSGLVQVVLQPAAATGMPQLAQRLGFYLSDALTSEAELAPDLIEGAGLLVLKAEAQPNHLAFARVQRGQYVIDLLLEQLP